MNQPRKRRSYVDIQREIDRKMGNKMVLDKIKYGGYKLTTGEGDPSGGANQMYAEKMEEEIKEVVERINSEEELEFSDVEVKNKTKDLQRQMKEGVKEMKMLVGDQKIAYEEDDEDEEKKKKKRLFF